jgi:hypothetical protein
LDLPSVKGGAVVLDGQSNAGRVGLFHREKVDRPSGVSRRRPG